MIPSDSAFASLRYSSFTFGGIVGEFFIWRGHGVSEGRLFGTKIMPDTAV
jgi:hypothetical protein